MKGPSSPCLQPHPLVAKWGEARKATSWDEEVSPPPGPWSAGTWTLASRPPTVRNQ